MTPSRTCHDRNARNMHVNSHQACVVQLSQRYIRHYDYQSDAQIELRCLQVRAQTGGSTTTLSVSTTSSTPITDLLNDDGSGDPPTTVPTLPPTRSPTAAPTRLPTHAPSAGPTLAPSTPSPTRSPTFSPTSAPTFPSPTSSPTVRYPCDAAIPSDIAIVVDVSDVPNQSDSLIRAREIVGALLWNLNHTGNSR